MYLIKPFRDDPRTWMYLLDQESDLIDRTEDGISCELTSPHFLADAISHDIRLFGTRHEYVRIGLIDEHVAVEKFEAYKQEIERSREADERRQYEKLKAKYDPPTPPAPVPTIKVKPGFRRAAFKTQSKQ